MTEIENAGGTVVLSKEPLEVVPGVWTTGEIKRQTSFEVPLPISEGEKLVLVVDGNETMDMIMDDQSLWMNVEGTGPYVIAGCSHAGPINTLLHVQRIGKFTDIHGFVGGTHLVGRSEEYLQQTIEELNRFGLKLFSPCHCTGFKATARLWQAFPQEFILNYSGRVIDTKEQPEDRIF